MRQTLKECVVSVGVVAVAVIGTAGILHAAVMNGGPTPLTVSGVGPGGSGGGVVLPEVAPNNDNSAFSTNSVFLVMTFTGLGPIDYVFNVTNSSGTTEYQYADVTINNTSGVTWTGFHFQLGRGGFGTPDAFVLGATVTDFDTGIAGTGTAPTTEKDPTPTSTAGPPPSTGFTVLDHQDTTIDWSGGMVFSGGVAHFGLSLFIHTPSIRHCTGTRLAAPADLWPGGSGSLATISEPKSHRQPITLAGHCHSRFRTASRSSFRWAALMTVTPGMMSGSVNAGAAMLRARYVAVRAARRSLI